MIENADDIETFFEIILVCVVIVAVVLGALRLGLRGKF